MSLSSHSTPSSPVSGPTTSSETRTEPQIAPSHNENNIHKESAPVPPAQPQISICAAPPTPPPEADDFRSPSLSDPESLLASPPMTSLSTSVSSPAWFPPFDPLPLVTSSSSATLFDQCLSPSSTSNENPAPKLAHKLVQSVILEDGEIAEAEAMMKKLGIKCQALEPGEVIDSKPVKATPTPPNAPSVATIPLPPDGESASPSSPSAATAASSPSASPPSPASNSVPAPTIAIDLPPNEKPSTEHKTPNVYINGLPPNFPEDQLFALARPFGIVRSVRSFTRHVGDAETGYGFVLFDDIESAERCINALRRYRNLHPTFSKQVHKIPGTPYANVQPASTLANPALLSVPQSSSSQGDAAEGGGRGSSAGAWEQESAGAGSVDSTFKAKMTRLADTNSTNLYIEGLPLSIDEATLSALVSPYAIRSSRFFQTKLSTPPRIIAFVRLETRAAAEEIIERLHGRMVRGWNDPGSRISVRFADTSEQRELRRNERFARDGDQASGQLSIAQATLLNLRGKELNSRQHDATAFEVDYSRAPPMRYPANVNNSALDLASLYQQQRANVNLNTRGMDPAMASLLQSLQGGGRRDHDLDDMYDFQPRGHGALPHHQPQQQQQHLAPQPHGITLPGGGYTPAEEFILRSAMPLKRRPAPLDLSTMDANIGMGVRGHRAHAATLAVPQQQQHHFEPQMFEEKDLDEEAFHAVGPQQPQPRQSDFNQSQQHQRRLVRGPSSTQDFIRTHPNSQTQQQQHYNARNNGISNNGTFRTPAMNNHNNNNMTINTNNSSNVPTHTNNTGIYNRMNNRSHNGPSAGFNHTRSHSRTYSSTLDVDQPSPALTYSSRGSTAAYSPATPFFNSFDEQENNFRATQLQGKKPNSRTVTR
ncbi:hypothetical protein R3P38DRAFT_3372601 [Favolaschia claudopus]|uniref:RRM domain-containing protein n=1 Tax=Favolaschia claudopus TaxID=2862362 RepID=A0AAV9ZV25_9AGAR